MGVFEGGFVGELGRSWRGGRMVWGGEERGTSRLIGGGVLSRGRF